MDDPSDGEWKNIRKQVEANYWVRTRADVFPETVEHQCKSSRRDAAFRSGAQIVSTDFQEHGMSSRFGCDYTCSLDDGLPARCNSVNAPEWCNDYDFGPEDA